MLLNYTAFNLNKIKHLENSLHVVLISAVTEVKTKFVSSLMFLQLSRKKNYKIHHKYMNFGDSKRYIFTKVTKIEIYFTVKFQTCHHSITQDPLTCNSPLLSLR